jgi:subtilisin family serine protease
MRDVTSTGIGNRRGNLARLTIRACLTAGLGAGLAAAAPAQDKPKVEPRFRPPPTPRLVPPALTGVAALDIQVDNFVRVNEARQRFAVSGRGLTVAVIDTGVNPRHVDFQTPGKLIPGANFSSDGQPDDTTDHDGHGDNTAGIIAARRSQDGAMRGHTGIAPDARIAPLKVFPGGDFDRVSKALQWVIDNRDRHNISVVNMSLGSQQNVTSFDDAVQGLDAVTKAQFVGLRDRIRRLRDLNVVVVVSAGNDYFGFQSAQGMAFPAICEETISVGAVFDTPIGRRADGSPLVQYLDGSLANYAVPGRCTPFTQRLGITRGGNSRTDIFAPGFLVTAAGPVSPDPNGDSTRTETTQDGTSQAGPVVAGVVLLLQERYLRLTEHLGGSANELPPVSLIEQCLRQGGVEIQDLEDAQIGQTIDNVTSSGETFLRLDAVRALEQMDAKFRSDLAHVQADLLKAAPNANAQSAVLDKAYILNKAVTGKGK